jgi:hypothetical protein
LAGDQYPATASATVKAIAYRTKRMRRVTADRDPSRHRPRHWSVGTQGISVGMSQ